MSKMTNCKACGKEIAKGVSKCIYCGKDQRNFFMRHKFLTVLLVILILAVAGNAIGGKKSSSAANNTKSDKPQITISAADLIKAYSDNEVKADKTYKDKFSCITGQIEDIGASMGSTYITLSDGQYTSIISIQCFFKDKAEVDKVSNLKKGDNVTIEGVIGDKSLNLIVNDCKIK